MDYYNIHQEEPKLVVPDAHQEVEEEEEEVEEEDVEVGIEANMSVAVESRSIHSDNELDSSLENKHLSPIPRNRSESTDTGVGQEMSSDGNRESSESSDNDAEFEQNKENHYRSSTPVKDSPSPSPPPTKKMEMVEEAAPAVAVVAEQRPERKLSRQLSKKRSIVDLQPPPIIRDYPEVLQPAVAEIRRASHCKLAAKAAAKNESSLKNCITFGVELVSVLVAWPLILALLIGYLYIEVARRSVRYLLKKAKKNN